MMLNYWGMFPMMIPCLPTNEDRPPTIYSIMQSICNFGKTEEERIKTKDLAKVSRETIFNFEYPLSTNVNKEDFECMILNHYMMRRINFDTVTLFNIQLNVKLNSIMPKYNKMFDMLENWKPFEDGEKQTHTSSDTRNIENTENRQNNATTNIENSNTTNNTLENESTTTGNNTSDNRFSNTPQNNIQNVKDGKYITEYRYTQDNSTTSDNSTSQGESTSNSNGTTTENRNENNTSNTKDTNILNETWSKTIADKISLYKEYQDTIQNIYDMIFSELDCLFYSLE